MAKSSHAFRTIGEAAEETGVSARTLRDWESKFDALSPLKRAGGRRYYDADAIALIRAIHILTSEHGLSSRGVRRLLDESGPDGVLAAAHGGDVPRSDPAGARHQPDGAAVPGLAARLEAALARLETAQARLHGARAHGAAATGVAPRRGDG